MKGHFPKKGFGRNLKFGFEDKENGTTNLEKEKNSIAGEARDA